MSVLKVGDEVRVQGAVFKIVHIRHAGANNSKFFGKFRFYMRDAADTLVSAFGKTVTGNSKLYPVASWEKEAYKL